MKNKDIRFLVTESFKAEVATAAKEDNKTLSGYITDCVLVDLKRRRRKDGKFTNSK